MTKPSFVAALCFLVPSTAMAQLKPIPHSKGATSPALAQPTTAVDDKPGSAEPEYYTPSLEEEPATPKADFGGTEIALGLGYGTSMGDPMKNPNGNGVAISDVVSRQIPLSVGLGYRIGRVFACGIAFQYAPLMTKNCDAGSSCSATDFRFGLEGRAHFGAEESFDPWLSFGVGYEVLSLSESGKTSGGVRFDGFDFDFQLGGDIRISKLFSLGPFVGLRVGNYRSVSSTDASAFISDANQTTHGWLTFGLRGSYLLMGP
jgi:hypothetical protein